MKSVPGHDVKNSQTQSPRTADVNFPDLPKREPIKFRCTNCATLLKVGRDRAGHTIKCPACEQRVAIPGKRPEPKLDSGNSDAHDEPIPGISPIIWIGVTTLAGGFTAAFMCAGIGGSRGMVGAMGGFAIASAIGAVVKGLQSRATVAHQRRIRDRHRALESLGQKGDVEALVERLGRRTDVATREAALQVLTTMGPSAEGATPVLLEMLRRAEMVSAVELAMEAIGLRALPSLYAALTVENEKRFLTRNAHFIDKIPKTIHRIESAVAV